MTRNQEWLDLLRQLIVWAALRKRIVSLVWKGLKPLSLMTRSWWYLFVGGTGSLSASCHHVCHSHHDSPLSRWVLVLSWPGLAWLVLGLEMTIVILTLSWHSVTQLSSSPGPAPSKTEHRLVSSNIPRLGLGSSATASQPHVQRGAIVIWSSVAQPCATISGHGYIVCVQYLHCSLTRMQFAKKEFSFDIKIATSGQRSASKWENSLIWI